MKQIRIELMLQGSITLTHPRPNTKKPLLTHPEFLRECRYLEQDLQYLLESFGSHANIGIHDYRIREENDDKATDDE